MKKSDVVDAITKRPLTAEERHVFGEFWKAATDVDKLEVACRMKHVPLDQHLVGTPEFVQVCAIICELDEKYETVTIPQ